MIINITEQDPDISKRDQKKPPQVFKFENV